MFQIIQLHPKILEIEKGENPTGKQTTTKNSNVIDYEKMVLTQILTILKQKYH